MITAREILSCYIVDDELAALTIMEGFVNRTEGLKCSGYESNSLRALNYLLTATVLPDILFLDVEMRELGGEEIARRITEKVLIVFTTGHAEFAVKSYNYNAVDFLLKPFSYTEFQKSVSKCTLAKKAMGLLEQDNEKFIFLKDSMAMRTTRVNLNDIVYIKAGGNYSTVFLYKAKSLMPHFTLKQIAKEFPSEQFIRVHKSYIINLRHVAAYGGGENIQLDDGSDINVGRTFRKKLKGVIVKMAERAKP